MQNFDHSTTLKNVLQGDLDVLMNRAEFIIFMQSRVPLGPGKFHVVVLVIKGGLDNFFYCNDFCF